MSLGNQWTVNNFFSHWINPSQGCCVYPCTFHALHSSTDHNSGWLNGIRAPFLSSKESTDSPWHDVAMYAIYHHQILLIKYYKKQESEWPDIWYCWTFCQTHHIQSVVLDKSGDGLNISGLAKGSKCFLLLCFSKWASLIAQLIKNPPTMQETLVRFLGWKDSPEKGKAIHSSILAWRIPWTV